MATLTDLNTIILRLPETKEGTHFHLKAYKVAGKSFIGIEKDQTHITLSMDKPDIRQLVKEHPQACEEIWRSGKYLIGVRVNLEHTTRDQLQEWVTLSWRHKAPKKVVKAFKEDMQR